MSAEKRSEQEGHKPGQTFQPFWRSVVTIAGLALLSCGHGRGVGESTLIPTKELALGARQLERTEAMVLAKQGVVILRNGSATSFHYGYTGLFHAHQPVYITADSLLHAWHSSYDAILMNVEDEALIPALEQLLTDLRTALAQRPKDEASADVDLYLAIAQTLLTGTPSAPVSGADPTRIAEVVKLCEAAAGAGQLELFGARDDFDFSMLKPRGHYTRSIKLARYFRSMSFLGRAELRLARKPVDRPWIVDRRSFRGAALFDGLFTAQTRKRWQDIDTTLASFVGPPDSMSLPGLAKGIAGMGPMGSVSDDAIVRAFDQPAQQRIRTQLLHAGQQTIAFVFLGQRFVYDSGVLSNLTWGSLSTDPPRLMPSSLDVAHAVFHHPQARELLDPDVKRYGAAYAAALDTEWKATDAEPPALWTGSLYHGWLNALRQLSPDEKRDQALPAPLNSKAWGVRMLNGQLASWAELRHDNLLYAKQSVTAMISCEFPFGYVDPYPDFYRAMDQLAEKTSSTIDALPYQTSRKAQLLTWLTQMRATMTRLGKIAERERANQPLLSDDLDFFNHMVSLTGRSAGCTSVTEPEGWFADLYWDKSKVLWHEPVIADVHTQPTDAEGNMVGKVLHVGTAPPRMMVVTLQHDGGKNAQTYRGFVSTYAELEATGFQRLTDEDWYTILQAEAPPSPQWLEPILSH